MPGTGWTARTLPVVKELLAADKRRAVVVMGHEGKEAMEERLRDSLGDELQRGAKVGSIPFTVVLYGFCNALLLRARRPHKGVAQGLFGR